MQHSHVSYSFVEWILGISKTFNCYSHLKAQFLRGKKDTDIVKLQLCV